jgi:ParB-like chromosome segregation protein Spo0J
MFGWKKDLPAIQDQDGNTVVGHRRLRLAKQLGIEPIIKSHHFKDDVERRELQVASNVGFSEMTKEDRIKVAQQMLTDDPTLTLEEIAVALEVNKSTISRDLNLIVADATIKKPAKTERNPKGAE